MNTATSVKSFIVKNNNLLIIKRRPNDVHRPGIWDIPGGRLNPGESPFTGLKRETKEETNLDIEIGQVLDVHYFTRQDGQIITMLLFLCKPLSNNLKLSQEHTDFEWIELKNCREKLHPLYHKVVDIFEKYNFKNL